MRLQKNKSLKEFTSFKIGGKAKYFADPTTFNEMKDLFKFAKKNKLKIFILGKGSNIVFDDRGFSGLVIYNNINFLKISKTNIYVGAGYNFAHLGIKTALKNLSGLEFASGVPGSVGGAIYMNASAFSQAISDTIVSVVYLTEDGILLNLKKDQLDLQYRSSIFQKMKGVILSAKFSLHIDTSARKKQLELLHKKMKNQPLNENNAGCIFKNPENMSAKKLIDECGLKNYKIGGAIVSNIHANFIINENGASSKDVIELISYIKEVVKKKKNIELFQEVKIIQP